MAPHVTLSVVSGFRPGCFLCWDILFPCLPSFTLPTPTQPQCSGCITSSQRPSLSPFSSGALGLVSTLTTLSQNYQPSCLSLPLDWESPEARDCTSPSLQAHGQHLVGADWRYSWVSGRPSPLPHLAQMIPGWGLHCWQASTLAVIDLVSIAFGNSKCFILPFLHFLNSAHKAIHKP